MVLRPLHVDERRDPDEEPPPLPIPDAHELADILLDAADGDVLGLERASESRIVSLHFNSLDILSPADEYKVLRDGEKRRSR